MNALSIHRVLPHLPATATWALALAIAVQAALIVRDLIPQPQSTPPPAVVESAKAPARSGDSQSMHLQTILNAHLFGAASADSAQPAAEAPQTQLSLVLAGTIAVDDPQKGIGLVGETAVNAKVYSVGENVADGVKLNAVYADRVILDRNGALETLYLPRQMPGSMMAQRHSAATGQPTPGAALANRVKQMINEDPGTIADIMRPQPVFAGGQQRGFRVYPGRNREHFSRLGLMPGDLIMAINGTPLTDPSRAMEIFRSMDSASEVSVTLERGGHQQELLLNMAQLAGQANELSPPAESVPPGDPVQSPPISENE